MQVRVVVLRFARFRSKADLERTANRHRSTRRAVLEARDRVDRTRRVGPDRPRDRARPRRLFSPHLARRFQSRLHHRFHQRQCCGPFLFLHERRKWKQPRRGFLWPVQTIRRKLDDEHVFESGCESSFVPHGRVFFLLFRRGPFGLRPASPPNPIQSHREPHHPPFAHVSLHSF